ncbi:SDR family NAD(P)-dependent oxidoreductase [Cohnella herbarum]|uniref:L-rhamnose 1-dehydrogenase (NAD(P)(+)) n=1 Tax=Cohnella herbarum TaxID=2728023 RepID=A0A7Z2VFU7_9BACL|nr:SDR family NAD(P)-dependent oxidoreductase [Cohnella herbarum]QJD82109.1 SDR family oxidoreductase [Cohnella herbarum]
MRLERKVALITGASRGIGKAVAMGFAREGAKVVILSDEPQSVGMEVVAEIASLGGQALYLQCDVSEKEQVLMTVEKSVAYFGNIDILVNNAGICPFHDFLTMPISLWERVTDVNQKGTFLFSQAVANHMVLKGTKGRIVSTSSIGAWVGGSTQTHYCPSKAAIENMMKSMAVALGPHGITCNSVLPGAIETDINREDLADPVKREYFIQRTPVRKLGQPEDLVAAYVFFASDDAYFVTGSSLLVDGGMFVNLQ